MATTEVAVWSLSSYGLGGTASKWRPSHELLSTNFHGAWAKTKVSVTVWRNLSRSLLYSNTVPLAIHPTYCSWNRGQTPSLLNTIVWAGEMAEKGQALWLYLHTHFPATPPPLLPLLIKKYFLGFFFFWCTSLILFEGKDHTLIPRYLIPTMGPALSASALERSLLKWCMH